MNSSEGTRLIPFNRPYVPASGIQAVRESLLSARLSGDGPYTVKASESISLITGASKILLTPSCTHALELACRLIGLGPGDEVILPSFNFPSAANAVVLSGATPVFVDVDPLTHNMELPQVLMGVSPRTRAIIVLHYAGVAAATREIVDFADGFGITVIEDSAHGFGVQSASGTLGSAGALSTYSFHETKNIQCGEGGAIQINSLELFDRAEVLREKGTNRSRFFRGLVDKYSWEDQGSSWLLADPLAALLSAQLDVYDEIQSTRVTIWTRYFSELQEWADRNAFVMPYEPPSQSNAAHMFYLICPSLNDRTRFIAHLQAHQISAVFHYQPLHLSRAGRRFARSAVETNETERLANQLVRLPLYVGLSHLEQDRVIDAITSFRT